MSEFLSRLGFVLEDLGPQTQWAELVRHAIKELESQEDQIATLATQRDACLAACKAVVEEDGFLGSAMMRKRIAEMKAAIALREQEQPATPTERTR